MFIFSNKKKKKKNITLPVIFSFSVITALCVPKSP